MVRGNLEGSSVQQTAIQFNINIVIWNSSSFHQGDGLRTPSRTTNEQSQTVQAQLMMFSFNMLDYPIQLEETRKVGYWATWYDFH